MAAAIVFQRHANRRTANWLAFLVAALAASMIAMLSAAALPPRAALLVTFLNANTELVFGPAIYLFVRGVIDAERAWEAPDGLYFLPAALGASAFFMAWLNLSDQAAMLEAGLSSTHCMTWFLGFKAAVLFTFLVCSCEALGRAAVRARSCGDGVLQSKCRWLRR